MALTETAIRKIKPTDKARRLFDAGGPVGWRVPQILRNPVRDRFSGIALTALATLMLAGCNPEVASQADARKAADNIPTAAGGSESCPLLSAAELSGLMGAKVQDAISIGGGCAFNYAGTDDFAATMESGPVSAYGPGGAKPDEYQDLQGIGEAAWIGRGYQNSWKAQARIGDKFVNVSVGGDSGTREVAIAVLRAALAKI